MMQYKKSNNVKLKFNLVSLAVVAALLSGCQSIGPDYMRQVFNLPSKYSQPVQAETANNAAPTAWWTQYQDAKLNEIGRAHV